MTTRTVRSDLLKEKRRIPLQQALYYEELDRGASEELKDAGWERSWDSLEWFSVEKPSNLSQEEWDQWLGDQWWKNQSATGSETAGAGAADMTTRKVRSDLLKEQRRITLQQALYYEELDRGAPQELKDDAWKRSWDSMERLSLEKPSNLSPEEWKIYCQKQGAMSKEPPRGCESPREQQGT